MVGVGDGDPHSREVDPKMTRDFIGGILAAAVILMVAAAFLWASPVRAAECRGTVMTASWYGQESGNRTADGSAFDGSQMVAAHRSWPFGTRLRVSYRGKSVNVVVRDRGPFHRGRQLDLSEAAAGRLGMIDAGVVRVCVERG